MATFSSRPRTLEDIFGDLAEQQVSQFQTQRVPVRTNKLAELAATGRLSSGIAEHSLGALDRDTALGTASIRAGVLPSMGQGVLQQASQAFQADQMEKEHQRNLEMAKLLGKMNKPSKLSEIFGGISSAGQLAGGLGSLMAGNPFGGVMALQGLSQPTASSGSGYTLNGRFS